ncbi:MAG: TIGR01777 family oxidoreductase [Candidatus Brocadiia bacterium]|nr:TIGR01777 family oxidoreductase [Candidatus Brocadiia bacterium]
MRAFITGGTGLIGRRLVGELLARGDSVAVLTRDAGAAREALPVAVELVEGDPTAPGPWQQAVSDADAVVNLAGEPIFARRWSAAQKRRILTSRVQATRSVVDAMANLAPGPRTLINASGVGYYGPRGDEELDEDSPAGSDFLAQVGREWEAAAAAATKAGIRVVLLRTGVVLAPEGGALKQMALPFRLHVGGPVGSGRQWVSWVHIEDLVGVILFALDNESIQGPVNGTAPRPVTNREFAMTLGRVLGRKSWLPVPRIALRVAIGQVADLAARGQRAFPRKAVEAGYRFRYVRLSDALEQILRS